MNFIRCTPNENTKHVVKKHWTEEEDKKLISAVEKVGNKSWIDVAKYVDGRNPKQCRERWITNLSPENNKEEWKIEDDVKLIKLYATYGSMWKTFTEYFKGRNDIAIKNRYNWLKRRSIPEYLEYQEKNPAPMILADKIDNGSLINDQSIETQDLSFNAFMEIF